jgi:cytochrome c
MYTRAMKTASLALVLLLCLAAGGAQAADPAAGKALFRTECGICHSPLAGHNLVGPSLFGVVGRTSGSVPGFAYSDASKSAHLVWTEAALNTYLKDPATAMPGTTMGYGGLPDDPQRADLVAYLATLK